jgi:CheY-like chemotaxis protein
VGTHVIVRVRDDGRGVDVRRVREKARLLNLPDTEDVLELLTHPGFSTRESADDLAGRGVGLDVVATIVRGLDGQLELTNQPGQGCEFSLRVPIRASNAMGLLLNAGGASFGIVLSSVERVMQIAWEELQQVEGKPAMRMDDEMVAVVELAELLGVPADENPPARVALVVLRQARRRLALVVSDIPSEQALLIRPFGRAFRNAELFIGGAVQADHSVVPVLSTATLFARASRTGAGKGQLVRTRPLAVARKTSDLRALVVDDSITMRTLLRNVLTAAGYQVSVAEDGLSALNLLRQRADFNIVVTDFQMPRMDGVELCRSIRALESVYVPIVMVTSVDDPEEKSRALSAGADAYVVKSTFEQTSFLKRVDTLVRGPVST